jgi:hypothetical protein
MALALVLRACSGPLPILQILLVFGAALRQFTWGEKHRVLPAEQRIGSALSVPLYALISLVALGRAALINIFAQHFSAIAMWVVF